MARRLLGSLLVGLLATTSVLAQDAATDSSSSDVQTLATQATLAPTPVVVSPATSVKETTSSTSEETAASEGSDGTTQSMASAATPTPTLAPTFAPTPAPTSRPFDLKLKAFSCDTDTVDVRSKDVNISCTAVVDSSEGVVRISAAFYNPPMTKRIPIKIDASQHLYQGDIYSGSFVADVTVPMATDQATWELGFTDTGAYYALEVLDAAGNIRSYSKEEAATYVENLQTRLQVNSYTGDLLAYPQSNVVASSGMDVKSIACLDVDIKTTAGDRDLTCTATVVPDESGLGTVYAYLVSPSNTTVLPLVFRENAQTQLLPNPTGGQIATMTSKISVGQYAEAGTYTLHFDGPFRMMTVSRAGTIKTFSSGQMLSNPTLTVVPSSTDTVAPIVTKFSCQSGQQVQLVNKGSVPLTCSLKGKDDLSGVAYMAMQFVSPSRTQSMNFAFVPDSPGLGDFPNTVISQVAVSQTISLTNATEPGPWTMVRAVGADNAGNYHAYSSEDLDAKNVQTYLLVQGVYQKFSIAPRAGSDDSGAPVKTVSPAAGRPSLSVAVALAAGLAMAVASFSSSRQ